MKVYLNAVEDGSLSCGSGSVDYDGNYANDEVRIGAYRREGSSLGYETDGIIDHIRLYERALTTEEIQQLYGEAFGGKAFYPNPTDGAGGVYPNVVLGWLPGEYVLSHDVYFGTNYNDVNDAVIGSPEYQGRYDITSWDPCGLELDTTYYWRIDEVNDANTWKGNVWSFVTSPLYKNQINFPNDPLCSPGISENDPGWVKFTIKLDDPCTVYFQHSQFYLFHYNFATDLLAPFIGMSAGDYYDITLYEQGQQAVLGAVIMPPMVGNPPMPEFEEYGIQFIRYDPYTKEEIADMFGVVKDSVIADPCVQAFYFPSYEQFTTAESNRDWFESQGIPISSTSRWAEGNPCYSEGWALGELKFFIAGEIDTAYQNGLLEPNDVLLTDAVPAEIPFVAGILSLSPSVPSSHVAILARTFGVPFAHLAVAEDATNAQQLIGRTILLSVKEEGGVSNVGLRDFEGLLTPGEIEAILALKTPPPLDISPKVSCGAYSADTNGLLPTDINNFGGKASNFGILRTSIPESCPVATAFSFDLWDTFLDQTLLSRESIVIEPGGYLLFWADNDEVQGPTHTNFKLSADGEYVGLYDTDGISLVDGITFGPQSGDVSYGRSPDGTDNWVFFSGGTASPGWSNTGSGGPGQGLFINEFMADNDSTIQDPDGSGYPDWIELYNAGPSAIDLSGMYLTDDPNNPNKWMIPIGISGGNTLGEEIATRLGGYTYPPADMAALSAELNTIRQLIKHTGTTSFSQELEDAVIDTLMDLNYGFDPNEKIRFRSSTNVEDSNQFTGAGLYDSYSGCLADDLDGDDDGPCACDPCELNERGVFRAIRKVFASFYNDNAFLERLRYNANEDEVGMALLVHHSFPDEFELANGVATVEKDGPGLDKIIKLVTQKGATSVANPEPGCIPEEVSVTYISDSQIELTLVRLSNLVILGETVMEWENDYNDLSRLLVDAANKFEQVTGKSQYILDFEYKKVAAGCAAISTGGVVVKQIRQIPESSGTPSVTSPFLINEPMEYCTFQGVRQYGSYEAAVFANHRLKSRWTFETQNMWLTPENLNEQSFYTDVSIEYVADGCIRTFTGQLPLLPEFFHNYSSYTTDGWHWRDLAHPRIYKIDTGGIPMEVPVDESPVVTLSDLGVLGHTSYDDWTSGRSLTLKVEYSRTGATDTTTLAPCPQPSQDRYLQERTFYDEVTGVNITTSFYWAYEPHMPGFTGPLTSWVETRIEGYTTVPIVLHGWYSQTYTTQRHNGPYDYFLFEPRLEPGISQNTLDELQSQDIRLIYFIHSVWPEFYPPSSITTYGFGIPGDFEPDGDVDLADFCIFAERWLDAVCDACGGADLTGDGNVQWDDLKELTDNWLAGVN